ncbi:MAG: efflux RND transporter periplasmic adaptor subunit [Devosia sp.]|nr:efflux RND transporter periplasmic adaptor subunit [Devosia sp.]
MKPSALIATILLLVVAALAAGYWWGMSRPAAEAPRSAESKAAPAAGASAPAAAAKPRILYYRNPMGLPDTSPVPKKDQMGMDYVPVYDGEEPRGPEIKISLDKVQKLGVRTEAATYRNLARGVRALGTVQVDERSQRTVAPRFEGWIQKLLVNTTGEAVRRGQPLMEVYSPDLVAAQQEYVIAWKGAQTLKDASPEIQASMRTLLEGSLQRLRNWDIGEEELRQLQQEGKARNALTLRSPAGGVVLEKPSIQGMRFMPGEVLYRIADLSSLWLVAEVFEQDLSLVRIGQSAKIHVNAYPERVFEGKVSFIYPAVTAETRTARVRIQLANPGQLLKPAMYAEVELAVPQSSAKRLTVPDSAVLDSGNRQVVLVRRDEGRFEPRAVKVGARGDGYVEVLDGIREGDSVVVAANFLIDSESNLRSALNAFGSQDAKPGASVTHKGEGKVEAVDLAQASVTLAHGPIASLKWPAMTMDFHVKDPALLRTLRPGQRIVFEFVAETGGEYAVVRVQPATPAAEAKPATGLKPATAPAPAAGNHSGH